MPEVSVKSSQRPKLMIRRGKKVTEGVEVQAVFAEIRDGQLKPSHEFSMDGENWRRLDSHPQLARVFASVPQPEPKKRGGLVFLFLIFLMLAAAGLYFHPYLVLFNVQTAVSSQNTQKLSESVDYSDVQQDIKDQLDGQWSEISVTQISNTPYAKLADPAGLAQVEGMINALVTPDAVMGFAKGETGLIVSWNDGTSSTPPAVGDSEDPSADLGISVESVIAMLVGVKGMLTQDEFGYAGLNSFVMTIKADNGESFDFMYERKGIDWKLSGITLPLEPVRTSLNTISQSVLQKARKQYEAENKAKKIKKGKNDKKVKKVEKKQVQVAKLAKEKKTYLANLELINLTVGKGKKYLFGSPNPGLFATLKNNGNRTLNEVEVTIYFFNNKGAIVSEKKLYPVSVSKYRPGRDNDPLNPKKAKKVGYLVKDFAPPTWAGKVQMRVTGFIFKEK